MKELDFNYVTQWDNAVVNTGIKWAENAVVHCPDGSCLQGGLYITYYEAKTDWLAEAIASEVGVDEVIAEVLPDGKEEVVRSLMAQGRTAMIGDGIV